MESLQIGGVGCLQMADTFGTPLYVYDENKIRAQAEGAVRAFTSQEFATEVVYASKAFSAKALFRLLDSLGVGLDVVSGGELYCAFQAGVDRQKIYFHGNNKSDEEIAMALEGGVGYFVVDNLMECGRIVAAAEARRTPVKALLRINPGISAHTHEYIMTATPDSKFGVHIKDRKQIEDIIRKLSRSGYVKLMGFHSHIGSQIMEAESFEKAIDTMMGFLADLQRVHTFDPLELSIGGGFGIRYTEKDRPQPLDRMCAALVKRAEEAAKSNGVRISKLITEPGRAMVGEAGVTLYTVGDLKRSGEKEYLFVDGGMSDNLRPALYQAEYGGTLIKRRRLQAGANPETIGLSAAKTAAGPTRTYCIAGKNCESGDVLIRRIQLPEAEPGDVLAVFSTGAYGYSMAGNYNRLNRPAVVFAADGKAREIIKRETYEDQYKLEI